MERETLYLVTGATGFIGNNIVRELLSRGKRVRCYVRNPERAKSLFASDPGNGERLEFAVGSVGSKQEFGRALEGDFDFAVVHAAGVVTIGKGMREELRAVNVEGTKNIADVCAERGVKRFVFVSSVHAIPEPPKGQTIRESGCFGFGGVKGDYAKTKSESTAYVHALAESGKLNAVILHPSGVVGPNDFGSTYLTKLILDYSEGKIPAGVKGGYNFVDVRDVAMGAAEACERGTSGECYLLTGSYVSVKDILGMLYAELHGKRIRHMLPLWAAKAALPVLTLYSKLRGSEPLYNSYSLYTLASNSDFCNEKAGRELSFSPRPISESVRDTVAFLRAERRLKR